MRSMLAVLAVKSANAHKLDKCQYEIAFYRRVENVGYQQKLVQEVV